MEVDSAKLKETILKINVAMENLNNVIFHEKEVIEKRLEKLKEVAGILKQTYKDLSETSDDDSYELQDIEENIDSVEEEAYNLEDVLESLNEFDLSPFLLYAERRLIYNDDILEDNLPQE